MPDLPNISPNDPNFAQLIEQRLKQYEAEYSIEKFPAKHRNHLGASSIGEDCWRKLWYQFRWAKLDEADPRMRRLWNRGHREEEIFERFLMWSGFRLRSINEKTGEQYKFSKINGHYGGSTDGICLISFAGDYPIITEYKTFAHKYFTELKEKKVRLAQPKYFAQLCSYGREFEVRHALFCAVDKDNDEWYWEFVELDWNHAIELEKKANDIIHAEFPPDKINSNPAFWKCKFCTFNGICHFNEPVEKNCRSCINASPVENAKWKCKLYGEIPQDFIGVGCGQHKGVG